MLFVKIAIMEMVSILSFRELGKSWQLAKRHGTLFVNLLFLVIFVTLGFVLIHQKFPFVPPDHFRDAVDSGCEVQFLGKGQINRQTTNSSHAILNIRSLTSAIS